MGSLAQSKKPAFISEQVRDGRYYFFDLSPRRRNGITIVCGGWEACTSAYRIERENFPYFSLEFVEAGRGHLSLHGQTHELRPGDVYSYGPGVPHGIQALPEEPLVKYFVDFVGGDARKLLGEAPFTEMQPLRVPDPSVIRDLFEDLQTFGASGSRRAPRLCATTVELLLLRTAETASTPRRSSSMAWARYEQCRQFIVESGLGIQSLEDVCEACNLDKAYLCRLFKRFSHESPYQLLTRLKMTHAAELLLHSDLLAKEIASRVGFEDPYHFSKTFKRVHGMGPAAFRSRGHR